VSVFKMARLANFLKMQLKTTREPEPLDGQSWRNRIQAPAHIYAV
jgi:hypothetical protein